VSQIAAPADKRFRRSHVKPSRSRRTKRAYVRPVAVSAFVLVVVLIVLARGRTVMAQLGVLQVDRVVVHGNQRLSKGEVLAVLNGLRGESLFWTDLDAWRGRLLSSPWVRDAALRRSLPSTVDVMISERQPIGVSRLRDDLYLVDERGVVIDQYGPQYADLDLPIIDGLAITPGGGSATDAARADLAARVIAAVRSKTEIARKLSQIDVSDLHNASVILSGDPAVLYLGDDQFLERLQSYIDLAPALHERVAEMDYVDLRFDERIYVRPLPGARGTAPEPAARPGKTKRR
jgi:cell division septal protein FtsQ